MNPVASSRNLIVWLILVAALAAGLGLWLGQRWFAPVPAAAAPALAATLLYPEPRAIAPFELVRADGGRFANTDLAGAWTLVFFGFTHCPDACPTTLAAFRAMSERDDVPATTRYLFVSVDPERDDAATLANYTRYFSPRIVAATADLGALEALTRDLGIVFAKSPLADGSYSVDHSTQVLLIDPAGRLAGLIRPPHDPARIAADLRTLAARS